MSNRRRLASEKARKPRCPKCRCLDLATKVWADGVREMVCERCQHVWNPDGGDIQ